jgi:hypothetical protein
LGANQTSGLWYFTWGSRETSNLYSPKVANVVALQTRLIPRLKSLSEAVRACYYNPLLRVM